MSRPQSKISFLLIRRLFVVANYIVFPIFNFAERIDFDEVRKCLTITHFHDLAIKVNYSNFFLCFFDVLVLL